MADRLASASGLSRRFLLSGAAALGVTGVAACGRKDEAAKAPAAPPTPAGPPEGSLEWAVEGSWRSAQDKARDAFRHPMETLRFYGLQPKMAVVEFWPGGGWYTEILAPYLARTGSYYAAAPLPNGAKGVQAHERGVQLRVGLETALAGQLVEAQDVTAILGNLVDNAVKYGGASGEIRLSAARIGDTLRLGVADSGPGIPSEARGRVLDRFVRLEEARSRPGFGLGLSLVNAVVRLHQGTLALKDNAPGLRVEIALPAERPA